jgi:hypothetical protein
MTNSGGAVQNGLVLRLSVPASGEMTVVGPEMAVKLAEQVGLERANCGKVGTALAELIRRLDPGGQGDVAFEFHKSDTELTIQARQDDRSAEIRVPLGD